MAENKSKIIKEAKEEVDEILSENVLKEINWYKQTAEWEEASKIDYAERKTTKKAKLDMAKKMLKLGFELEKICEITELSISEIENLKV